MWENVTKTKLILESKNNVLKQEQRQLLQEKQRLEASLKDLRASVGYYRKISLENRLFSYQIDSFRRSTNPSIPIKKSWLFNW